MPAKHQYVDIEIPRKYKPADREAIAAEVIDYIRARTQQQNVNKRGRKFPAYSEAYVNSPAFKDAGKSRSKVDLTLSEQMLSAMELLRHTAGNIRIGFQRGSEENGKADGNIRGTYGQPTPNPRKARDFLGITKQDLAMLLGLFPLEK